MSKDLVFIASGGRTGTQFFGHRFKDIIEDCWSEHEPDMVHGFSALTLERIKRFGLWHMVIGRVFGKTGIRIIGRKYLAGDLNKAQMIARIKAMRDSYHHEHSENLIIESYAIWWMLASEIEEIWPGAKVLGVIRDPRTWIESWIKHEPERRNSFWKEAILSSNVTPMLINDHEWIDRWKGLNQIGKLAWEWRSIYERIYEASINSDSIKIFRFEDIFIDTKSMEDVLEFVVNHKNKKYKINQHKLDDFSSGRINASKGSGKSWESWSIDDVRLVEEICGPLMRHFNYGTELEWIRKLRGES